MEGQKAPIPGGAFPICPDSVSSSQGHPRHAPLDRQRVAGRLPPIYTLWQRLQLPLLETNASANTIPVPDPFDGGEA